MKKTSLCIICILLLSIFTFCSSNLVKAEEIKNFKITIYSPGNKNEIYEGEKLKLNAIVRDENGRNISSKIKWESENSECLSVSESGLVTGLKEGNTSVIASLKEDETVKTSFNIIVNHKEQVDQKEVIKKALSTISDYYREEPCYDYLPAMAARTSGNYFGVDYKNFKRLMIHPDRSTNTAEDIIKSGNALYFAENIMTIIASGKDPNNYDYKGEKIHFVDKLVKSQDENGQFMVQGVFEKDNIKCIAYSILALDMAGADYNKESAVKELIRLNKKGTFDNAPYGEIGFKAMTITALANHKDVEGAKDMIDSYIEEFKTKQNDKGGFDGGKNKINSSVTTAMVIQGLIANDVEPLSWFNSGKSMLDSILEHQKENGTFIDADGESNVDYIANDNCYAALSDLYTGKSMFKEIRAPKSKDVKVELVGDNSFKNGQDANFQIKVINSLNENKNASLIVGLYDKKSNEMIKYSYINKNIVLNTEENLKSGFFIPSEGDYVVKIFVWDSMESMTSLSDILKINVEK